ncbi:MAG: arsenate reductase (glutaredoxin) [Gemmatimonadota bacterium]
MSEVTLYHNPRCSKSRQALQLLRDRGVEPVVVEYLKNPPGAAALGALLARLGMEARELLRADEAEYETLGLAARLDDREALIRAMVEHPILIQRPIAVRGDRARLGRPPERVLELL